MKSWDWEEKAFAKDGGSFGVCTWPPRSYTCSFCMRDFKSAQALGGHMNIHRRDRAKLKQSLIGLHSDHHHKPSSDQQNHLIPSKPMISIDFTNINIKVVDPAATSYSYSYSSVGSSTTHDQVASSDFVSASLCCRSQKKQRIGEYPFLSNFPCLDTTVRLMTTLEYSKPTGLKNIINRPRDNIVSVETDLSTVGLDSEVIHELKTTTAAAAAAAAAATNLDLELRLG